MDLIVAYMMVTVLLSSGTVNGQHIESLDDILNRFARLQNGLSGTAAAVDESETETETLLELTKSTSRELSSLLSTENYLFRLKNEMQQSSVGEHCLNDTLNLIDGVLHSKTWALTFIDAFGKLSSGLLTGAFIWPGMFSQCRSISVTASNSTSTVMPSDGYDGQYCMVSISKSASVPSPMGVQTMGLRIGACVPDSCSSDETANLVNQVINMINMTSSMLKASAACKPNQKPSLDTGAIVVITLLSILGALITIATFYDFSTNEEPAEISQQNVKVEEVPAEISDEPAAVNPNIPTTLGVGEYTPLLGSQQPAGTVPKQQHSLGVRLLLCFSLLTNGAKLLSTKPTSQKTLACVHGIRFLSMSWVILGHSIGFSLSFTKNPAVLVTDYLRRYSFTAILGASVSVDTFFLLSGILAGYLLLNQIKEMNGPKCVNWALVYLHRFWRLTPPYMLVIAVYTTLVHYMGTGPTFPETADKNCASNWWQNLLYVNNFVSTSTGCMGWSWYLANDMQFFLITPLLVIALYKWVLVGFLLIFALMLMNMVVVGVLTAQNNYPADIAALNITAMAADPNLMTDWMKNIYVRPYARVGVYVVGVALGYLLYSMELKAKLNRAVVIVGWIVAAVTCYEIVYGLHGVASGQKALSSGVNAFYASVQRIVWGIGVSWVIFACTTGYGGPVNRLLSWSVFIPLSRLTYMAYLVHPIVMQYVIGTAEQTLFISDMSLVYAFIGNLVLSYAVAFVTSLAFEAPMMALEKVIFPKKQ